MFSTSNHGQTKWHWVLLWKQGFPEGPSLIRADSVSKKCVPFGVIWGSWKLLIKPLEKAESSDWKPWSAQSSMKSVEWQLSQTETLHVHLIVLILAIIKAYLLTEQEIYLVFELFLAVKSYPLNYIDYFVH